VPVLCEVYDICRRVRTLFCDMGGSEGNKQEARDVNTGGVKNCFGIKTVSNRERYRYGYKEEKGGVVMKG